MTRSVTLKQARSTACAAIVSQWPNVAHYQDQGSSDKRLMELCGVPSIDDIEETAEGMIACIAMALARFRNNQKDV